MCGWCSYRLYFCHQAVGNHNRKDWKSYWQGDDVELIHFIGKDNIVFHCIIFPIILRSHGNYALPTNVPANEFLNLEGEKLSTSKNWAIWLHEYIEDFENQQDVLRYVLCATAPESKDTDFTWKDFQTRNNSELVGILGNFVNRVVVLTNKYWDGKVPQQGELTTYDQEVLQVLKDTPFKIGNCIEKYKFREALSEMMSLARLGNKYLADTEPWKLKKTDEERTQTIIMLLCNWRLLCLYYQNLFTFHSGKISSYVKYYWKWLGAIN